MRDRDLFVVAAPGLEAVVAAEIAEVLGGPEPSPVEGGVEVHATDLDLLRLNLRLRAGTRVLARVAAIRAASFSELHRRAARVPWEDYLRPGAPVVVRASAKRSRLYHTGGITERILKGIAERLGSPAQLVAESDAGPDAQRIVARLVRDRLTLSVDASGERLHRRGYRQATAKAPLRETLAAGILMAAPLQDGDAILDPMCGAGTLAIEGALLLSNTAPGRGRDFACERWPSLAPELLERARAGLPRPTPPSAPIVASDRDPGACGATAGNASRAGVDAWLKVDNADVSEIEPPAERGLVVTNPPYGIRISERRHLSKLYASLGETLRQRFTGPEHRWRLALLCPDPSLAAATGLRLERRLRVRNGGIAVELWVGPIR